MNFLKSLFNRKSNGKSNQPKTNEDVGFVIEFDEKEWLSTKVHNIGDKYLIHQFVNEIPKHEKNTSVLCKSFLSEGMNKVGQQEIILTIAVPEDDTLKRYISIDAVLPFFNLIYKYAEKGIMVTDGGHTIFSGQSNVFGFKAIVYAQNLEKANGQVPNNCLSVILLHEREMRVASEMGYMRLLTMMGYEELRYPFPLWNKFQRQEVRLLNDMIAKTLLTKPIPKFISPKINLYQDEERKVNLVIPEGFNSEDELFSKDIFKIGHVTILPGFDLSIKFCKTWSSNPRITTLLNGVKDGEIPKPFRIMGCVVYLIGYQKENLISLFEDGYSVFMTEIKWNELFEAYNSRSDFSFDTEEREDGSLTGFKLVWKD